MTNAKRNKRELKYRAFKKGMHKIIKENAEFIKQTKDTSSFTYINNDIGRFTVYPKANKVNIHEGCVWVVDIENFVIHFLTK